MANNIAVSITADVVDLQAKRAIMSAELKAATKDLNAFAKEAASTGGTDQLRAGMLASAEAAEKARAKIALVTQEIKELNHVPEPPRHGFEALTATVSQTGIHLKETVGQFGEFRAALAEVAEVLIVAFAVERIAEWAEHMGEAAEKTKHMAETFGMTVPEVQGLSAVAKETGMDVDALAKGMGILDKNTVTAGEGNGKIAAALKAVGIAANDGRSQMERMLVIADRFKDMDDGPKKVALAMELFGKSGKELIPVLNMGAEGLQEMDRVTQEYGAGALFASAANKELRDWLDQVNARGMALADATDTTKVAMQGLGNVMTDAFAPILTSLTDGLNSMIKAFIDSYREGGIVAVVMGTITTALEAVWEVVKALGQIFYEVFSAIVELVGDVVADIMDAFGIKTPQAMHAAEIAWNVFKDAVVIAKDIILVAIDAIIGIVEQLVGNLVTFGKVAWDAFSLNWGAIEGDWASGMARVEKQIEASSARIKGHVAEMNAALTAAAHGEALPGKPAETHEPKGVKDFDPDLAGAGKKGPKTTIAQKLEEELEAKKTAWAMEQDAQGTYQQYSLQSEADFWQQALKRTDLSAKDKLEIERKYLAARQALIKEKQQQETDDAKQSEALAIEAAKTQNDLARLGIQAKLNAIEEARRLGTISANEAVQQHRDLNAQLYQLDVDLENKEHAIKLKGLQDQRAILGQNSEYYRKIDQQIELLEKQHQDKITVLNAQGNQKRLQDDRKVYEQTHKLQLDAIHSLSQSWSSTLGKMLTLQTSFANGIKSMWQGLVGVIGDALGHMIEKWLEKQLTALILGRAQQAVTGVAQVTSNAAVAASGAYAATAMIPIIGPALAPAAAATALAGAMSFAPLASAEGGDWQVRGGLYNLHPDEMVLPAHLARPMRAMIEGGANDNTSSTSFGRSAAASGSRGGDVHNHNYNIKALDGHSVKRVLMNNLGHFATASKEARRQGHFAGMRRA